MSLAMLVSHYSTGEFAKWREESHLRPYVPAFTHKDNHAARPMLLSASAEPHAHADAALQDRRVSIHLRLARPRPACVDMN